MWRLIFPTLACVLFGAHALFNGFGVLAAAVCILFAAVFWIPRAAAAHIGASGLILMGGEWMRTACERVTDRIDAGMPYTRVGLILAGCALFTWFCAWLVYRPALKKRWKDA